MEKSIMPATLYSVKTVCDICQINRTTYEYHKAAQWLPCLPTERFGKRMYYVEEDIETLRTHFDKWRARK